MRDFGTYIEHSSVGHPSEQDHGVNTQEQPVLHLSKSSVASFPPVSPRLAWFSPLYQLLPDSTYVEVIIKGPEKWLLRSGHIPCKTDSLRSIPGTHTKAEGENQLDKGVLEFIYVCPTAHVRTHIIIINREKIIILCPLFLKLCKISTFWQNLWLRTFCILFTSKISISFL